VTQPSAQDFLDACDARPPLRLEIEHCGWGDVETLTLALPFTRIGRDKRAEICLEDESVSRRHAFLQMVAGQWWWVDLNSRTGTQAGGATLASAGSFSSSGPLLPRHGIRIGPYAIRPASEGLPEKEDLTAPANPLTRKADDPLLPRPLLDFDNGAGQQTTWKIDRPLMIIGSASLCKLRLHSPLISRTHCALLHTAAGLWVVDLLSRTGILVNGKAVPWGRLGPEDELQIGPFRIHVRYESEKVAFRKPVFGVSPCIPSADSVSQAIVPSAPVLPRNANEELLWPLLTQFSLMQQQMFEQFQNTLLEMARTFSNLHGEQLTLVRQELEHIQELTRQLHTLQAEEKRQTALPPPSETALPLPSSASPTAALPAADTLPSAPAHGSSEVHLWLSQRLAALQQERQTCWQRLLTFVTGK
jgi:pSer/pThr/pTyr-binding forkhead associated (FHA) protein